jgi:hypothetical protein
MKIFNKYFWTDTVYDFFRRDIWRFFANIWRFRKELYNHSWWDYYFTLQLMYRSISIMEKNMHKGLEIRETREKKIEKMQRVLFLLKTKIEDSYVDLAEQELGISIIYKGFDFEEIDKTDKNGDPLYVLKDNLTEEESLSNRKIYDKAREIEENHWNELWEILRGTKKSRYLFPSGHQILSLEDKEKDSNTESNYLDHFDGTDMRGWWD